MKSKNILVLFVVTTTLLFSACNFSTKNKFKPETRKDKNGYAYESFENDPLKTRIYKLKNGLTIYLTVNRDKPRIQTYIAVKAGGIYDPAETTGLAHYLEHMMFKGSSKFGTIDWEKEKVMIEKLSDLFEKHRKTTDPNEKKKIYASIDSLSSVAAKLAVANEYDKMVTIIGAKGTNAYTGEEQTVYINDIPSNEMERWLNLEKERFSSLVLRIFHTELETVYEEFNMGQDDDDNKVWETLAALLYKKHPYGTQTIIGKAEHLKNPSMVNIMNYWKTFYVPSNMAICMSGDLDFEQTVSLIDKTFGQLPSGNVPEIKLPKEEPITSVREKTVYGPNPEYLMMAYRFDGEKSDDKKMVTLINSLLYNGTAGLIDLELNQKQKILSGWSYYSRKKDYGEHILSGTPRKGQNLEQVRDLLLAQIEKIKNGDFDDWMLEANINNLKLQQLRSNQDNGRAHNFVEAFTKNMSWGEYLQFNDELKSITKQQIVDFAKSHYSNNYVVVYKKIGQDTSVVKVDKPSITPVNLNRDAESVFKKDFVKQQASRLKPVFYNFEESIKSEAITPDVKMHYIKNNNNELFTLQYIIDMGKDHNPKLELAVNYLPYLGTTKYSATELQKELFRLGLNMGVWTGKDRSYIYISGLSESFGKALELLDHIVSNARPDEKAYNDYIEGILKTRADQKLDKSAILWQGMINYGLYGPKSSFTDIISEQELKKINPSELTFLLKDLFNYKHRVLYYGPHSLYEAKTFLAKKHVVLNNLMDCPSPKKYIEQPGQNNVFFVNYDMVQANILLLAVDETFQTEIIPMEQLFNEYYGGSMSSIVFQEIREAKALAYSAFAYYNTPQRLNESCYTYAYVATQADKLKIATESMLALMNNMPRSIDLFNASKESLLKKIESERLVNTELFWNYQRNLDIGLNYDVRKEIYNTVKTASFDDMQKFFDKHIKWKKYNFLVIGNKDRIDRKVLESLGTVKDLSLEEIFNY